MPLPFSAEALTSIIDAHLPNEMAVDAKERAAIDKWIQVMKLDRYGNKEGTMYAGGNPAFNMRTGEMTDRYEYIVAKHPQTPKPWEAYLPQTEL